MIVLVGLNGRPNSFRKAQEANLAILSDRSQVALLIKPVSKPRDLGLQWTADLNVSLVDIFPTVKSVFLPESPAKPTNGLADEDSDANPMSAVSLSPSLSGPTADEADRWIYTESAWADWRGVGNVRSALRKNQLVYLNDYRPTLYNSLTDSMETSALSISERSDFSGPAHDLLSRLAIPPYKAVPAIFSPEVPSREKIRSCTVLFQQKVLTDQEKRGCDSRLVNELFSWFSSAKGKDEKLTEDSKRKFLRNYIAYYNDNLVSLRNQKLGNIWDVSARVSLTGNILEPLLELPQLSALKAEITKTIQNVITPNQKGTSESSSTKQ